MNIGTVRHTALIDIGPDGIKLTMEGMDDDLVKLLQQALTFEVDTVTPRASGTSDITIRSIKLIQFADRPITP